MVLHMEREPYNTHLDIWRGYATDNYKEYFLGKCITNDFTTARAYFKEKLQEVLESEAKAREV